MDLLLTDIGADLASQGFITGEFPKISKVKFGDGDGRSVTHKSTDTHLVNIVYETEAVAGLREERVVNVVAVVPIEIGGFTVREIGLFTSDDKMVAVTKVCDFPKPNMGDDPTHQTIYMRIAISDTQCIDIDFNTDLIYAPQSGLDEANNHIQILYDELRKRKALGLSSSTVLLDGKAEPIGVADKLFSYTGVFIGDGVSTGQAIDIGMTAKDFNKKNNGSGYWMDYNSTTNILLVKDDNDNIIREGEISFPSVKIEIYRYDAAVDRFRYSSVIGLEKSHSITNDTASNIESVSSHLLGFSDGKLLVSKVSNTLNGKYIINAKYMNRIKWYTGVDGGVWVQAYNSATDYSISYGRIINGDKNPDYRSATRKPIDYIYLKPINAVYSNLIGASCLGEVVRYSPVSSNTTIDTSSTIWRFGNIDNIILWKIPSSIIYVEAFTNSKYMVSGSFTMSSASDAVVDIKDDNNNNRLLTSFTFKQIIAGSSVTPYYQTIKKDIATTPIYNSLAMATQKPYPVFEISKGKYKLIDTTQIAFNRLYHYIAEFDSGLDTKIKTIGVL